MVFDWSLSDSKFPQISRTLLSILAGLSNGVVWMVSSCPLIFECSSAFTNPLEIVASALITLGITVTFMSHVFFYFSGKVWVLFSLFVFFYFYFVVRRNGKIHSSASSLFFCWLSLGLVVWPRFDDLFVSQNPREFLCVSFSRTDSGLCIYHYYLLLWKIFTPELVDGFSQEFEWHQVSSLPESSLYSRSGGLAEIIWLYDLFLHQIVFHKSLSDIKSPHASLTLLTIQGLIVLLRFGGLFISQNLLS